jgi:hypothetical protein
VPAPTGSHSRNPICKHCLEQTIMIDVQDIQRRIIELDVEHRDLDAVISMLTADGHADGLQLRRLKKRKLQLKDHITLLKMQLVPDIPA